MNIIPKLGSKWVHHNGLEYTVILIANIGHVSLKYPITIVYEGENGNMWAKPIDNFYENLTPKGFN